MYYILLQVFTLSCTILYCRYKLWCHVLYSITGINSVMYCILLQVLTLSYTIFYYRYQHCQLLYSITGINTVNVIYSITGINTVMYYILLQVLTLSCTDISNERLWLQYWTFQCFRLIGGHSTKPWPKMRPQDLHHCVDSLWY